MIATTQGIVLRSIKYGETSLVTTVFTRTYGVQTYLVQGARLANAKSRQSRAGLLQPSMLLDLTVYHKPGGSLQRMKEFSAAYIYNTLQEEVVKNSVALFSIELIYRLLPEDAPAPELFDFVKEYFEVLDRLPATSVANFPLFFAIQCSRYLGYEINGKFSEQTPHLNLHEGGFTASAPLVHPHVTDEEASALNDLLMAKELADISRIAMSGGMRQRLLEWYIAFLHRHTEHMKPIRSLAVLQAVLH